MRYRPPTRSPATKWIRKGKSRPRWCPLALRRRPRHSRRWRPPPARAPPRFAQAGPMITSRSNPGAPASRRPARRRSRPRPASRSSPGASRTRRGPNVLGSNILMAHVTTLRTQITDIKALCAALTDLGFNDVEVHDQAENLHGFRGDQRQQTAEVIVRRKHLGWLSNDLG